MESVVKPVVQTGRKKVKMPFALRFIRWAFPKVERVAPRYAHTWFVKLFFSPLRYSIPEQEKEVLARSERFTVTAGSKQVECYTWGTGPLILLVHGWAGRASQFRSFIHRFTDAGYKVVSFDAPAHGLSKGSQTTIIDFKDVILALKNALGEPRAVIGHSLGGTASLYALTEGLNTQTVVTISTPTIGEEIIGEFSSRINSSPRAGEYLKTFIRVKYNRSFDELMASHFAQRLPREVDLLVIHDEHDKEASLQNAHRMVEAYPKAQFIKTTGLGHVRILRDDTVIETCLAFIEDRLHAENP